MKGEGRPPIYMVANVSFESGDKRHFVKMNICQMLPDMPIGGKVFDYIECWTSSLIVQTCLKLVQEKCPDVQHLLCSNPDCAKRALGACTWYPFPIHLWNGVDVPQIFPPDEDELPGTRPKTCPWQLYSWCGNRCKFDMISYSMASFNRFRDDYGMLGGDYYCYHCGYMLTHEDYNSLDNGDAIASFKPGVDDGDMLARAADALPLVVNAKEGLVYCREGVCQAKCRQRAPVALLKQMHEERKKSK